MTHSNAIHVTAKGNRRNVKSGTTLQVWLDDCQGRTTPAIVKNDAGFGKFVVAIQGFDGLAHVEWNKEYNAYRITRWVRM